MRELTRIAPRSGSAVGGALRRVPRIVFVGLCATPLLLFVPANRMRGFVSSKHDIAHATVNKFAHEAYVQWAQEHPSRARPANLGELSEYMSSKYAIDPWDSPYLMLPAKRGILVMSAGEDRMFGTSDDLRSDE